MNYELFIPTVNDIPEIEKVLSQDYLAETAYKNLTYSKENTLAMIREWLDGIAIAAKADGKIIAFAAMGFIRTFYEETEADVDMFYINPKFRGAGVARAMCNALVANAEKNNAKVIYTSCLSGINERNNKLYANLWKKFGFEVLGTVMIRS